MNCIKHHNIYNYFVMTYLLDSQYTTCFSKITDYHTSVFLYNSSSVTIHNMNIIAAVMTNFTAILTVNPQGDSKIINLKVKFNSFNCTTFSSDPVKINGFVAYYSGGRFNAESKLAITNFYYNNTEDTCGNHFHCAVALLFFHNICNNKYARSMDNELYLQVHIQNSVFSILKILVYCATTNKIVLAEGQL